MPTGSNMLVPVMGVSIINGIFSPWVLVVFVLYPVWYPSWGPNWAQAVYMASALILATLTIMAAGIPAALYERFAGQPKAGVTGAIWLAGTVLLTLPALANVLKALGIGA